MYVANVGTFLQRDPLEQDDDGVLEFSHKAVSQFISAKFHSNVSNNHKSYSVTVARDESNLYEYALSNPSIFTDPLGLASEPGVLSEYWYYLWNPCRMDPDLQRYQKIALTTAAVSGAGAAGLGAASYYGVTAVGVVPLSQIPATVTMEYQVALAAAAASAPLTPTLAQRLAEQSGGRVVIVFTRLSQTPAGNRALHTAMNPRLCQALPNSQANQMFIGRIPTLLFNDMLQRDLIQRQIVNMGGVTEYAYVITAEGMPFVQQFFK